MCLLNIPRVALVNVVSWWSLFSAPSKTESDVVPKVARMTVSGRKQTMGFDVPR